MAESAAIDETSSDVDPVAEVAPEVSIAPSPLADLAGVVITAQVRDAGQPGGSIHVFQVLVRQVAEPPPQEPSRESRVDEPRESRDVPIITTGENPRSPETSMRGFQAIVTSVSTSAA